MLKNLISKFRSSEYLKNVTTLASGTTLAQTISIFTAPILYRIYDKDDYGTLGLYIAIVGVIGVFSTLQYLQPILLEKDDEDAKKIMWLNRVINTGVTFLVFLIVIFLDEFIGIWLNNSIIIPWLYFLPISIFFSGQNAIFRVWANRKKKYSVMSMNTILTAILVPLVSIGFGLLEKGSLGLFLGLLTSQIVPAVVLLIALSRKEDFGLKYLDFPFIQNKAKQYSNFPLYSLPSEFINRLTNQMPVFMLSIFVGPSLVGVYSLCVRMLGLPVQLIGGAVAEVFRQKASLDYQTLGNFRDIFIKTLKTLILISIPPIIIVLFFGPNLFELFFGDKWLESGVLAQIMIFYFMLKLIISPLSYSIIITNKMHVGLIKDLVTFIVISAVFYLGFKSSFSYRNVIFTFCLFYSVLDITYLSILYYFSKSHNSTCISY